jgi:hypothetical protein
MATDAPHAACSLSPASSSNDTDSNGDSIITDAAGATTTTAASQSELLEYVLGAARAGGGAGAHHHPTASSSSASRQSPLPAGPVLSFGPRLGYTYFAHPAPRAEVLNALTPGSEGDGGDEGIYWFTVDDQLQYLSFFQDYGPLNVGCL